MIADYLNERVLRWSRRQETTRSEIIVDGIDCWGSAMDHQRSLYVPDVGKDEIRQYTIGDKNGIVVADGNGKGNQLNQLNFPIFPFCR